jgi:hypothetical protein
VPYLQGCSNPVCAFTACANEPKPHGSEVGMAPRRCTVARDGDRARAGAVRARPARAGGLGADERGRGAHKPDSNEPYATATSSMLRPRRASWDPSRTPMRSRSPCSTNGTITRSSNAPHDAGFGECRSTTRFGIKRSNCCAARSAHSGRDLERSRSMLCSGRVGNCDYRSRRCRRNLTRDPVRHRFCRWRENPRLGERAGGRRVGGDRKGRVSRRSVRSRGVH